MEEKMIGVIELARRAGILPENIYQKLWIGKLKGQKVSGSWQISETEADRFLAARKARQGAEGNES
jgi:hypothetical protein